MSAITNLALIAASAWGFPAQPEGVPPQAPPSGVVAPLPAATDPVPAFLTLLEESDRGLLTLTADVKLDQLKGIDGDRYVRWGRVWYENRTAPAAVQRFAVRFERVRTGDRVDDEVQELVCDGEWFVERKPAIKEIIKRQIARPGQSISPFRVGEGTFPIPIGQKREAIEARYDVTLHAPAEGLSPNDPAELNDYLKFVDDTRQLRLVPKAAIIEGEELREIRLWYRTMQRDGRDVLLPRLAMAVNRAGDVTFVQLINIRTGADLPADVLDVRVPDGWQASIHALPPESPLVTDQNAPKSVDK